MYTPYQNVNREWYYADKFRRTHGPFISEERCMEAAENAREKDEEAERGYHI